MKKMILSVMLISALALAACSDDKAEKVKEIETIETTTIDDAVSENAVINDCLTGLVEQEQGVVSGKVYEENGIAIGKIEVDEKTTSEKAKEIVERYTKLLSTDYEGKKVIVQATKGNKTVAEKIVEAQAPTEQKIETTSEGTKIETTTASSAKAHKVSDVDGRTVLDPILSTYVLRIPFDNVDATKENVLILTIGGTEYEMTFDDERNIFSNGAIKAKNEEEVLAGTFIIK